MPTDEYASAAGGSLKLKGVNSSSKVTKKKKKRPKSPEQTLSANPDPNAQPSKHNEEHPAEEAEKAEKDTVVQREEGGRSGADEEMVARNRGKTDAELRHEERRRRRVWHKRFCHGQTNIGALQLDERLKREGTKTHKERVEELNRYLSNLSEHHDMYVSAFPFLLCATGVSGSRCRVIMGQSLRC